MHQQLADHVDGVVGSAGLQLVLVAVATGYGTGLGAGILSSLDVGGGVSYHQHVLGQNLTLPDLLAALVDMLEGKNQPFRVGLHMAGLLRSDDGRKVLVDVHLVQDGIGYFVGLVGDDGAGNVLDGKEFQQILGTGIETGLFYTMLLVVINVPGVDLLEGGRLLLW